MLKIFGCMQKNNIWMNAKGRKIFGRMRKEEKYLDECERKKHIWMNAEGRYMYIEPMKAVLGI